MTSATSTLRRGRALLRSSGAENADTREQSAAAAVPLTATQQFIRGALIIFCVLTAGLLAELLVVSPLQSRAAQQRNYDKFRSQLATGTAPLAAGDLKGLKGKPVSYLEVPSIGLRQVVLEGSDASTLFSGPGHRRDTPLPGQSGTSVILGRRAAFGGPFARIDSLKTGADIRVTTGAGVFVYRVIDVRRSGDPAPPALRSTAGRVVLVTADGTPFVPSGLVLVDADLITPGLGGGRPLLNANTLPDSEKLLGIDLSTLWRLLLWLQALIVAVAAALYAWLRWDRAKTWIVFTPALIFVGLMTAGEVARLLPNLL